MAQDKLEEQSRLLAQQFLGRELQRLDSMDSVLSVLGQTEVMLIFENHQWVAIESRGDRIHFFDPAGPFEEVGFEIPESDLPSRRLEDEGEWSSSVADLERWLGSGKLRALQVL